MAPDPVYGQDTPRRWSGYTSWPRRGWRPGDALPPAREAVRRAFPHHARDAAEYTGPLHVMNGVARVHLALAEHPGDPTPDEVQHLLARADRDADVRDDLTRYVREHLSHPV